MSHPDGVENKENEQLSSAEHGKVRQNTQTIRKQTDTP
jgi:hypothetical protein